MTLLRATGHVLNKIDGEDPKNANVINKWWNEIKKQKDSSTKHIFWNFIEDERNLVLKEYNFKYIEANFITDGIDVTQLDELLFVPLLEGPFAGEDCRDIIHDAITWWEEQLLKFEA